MLHEMVLFSSLPSALVGIVVLSAAAVGSPRSEIYSESLRLTGLPDGKAHSRFKFNSRGGWDEDGHRIGKNVVG